MAQRFLLGSMDGFHKATKIKLIILGVFECIFGGRVPKALIKLYRKVSERSVFMKVGDEIMPWRVSPHYHLSPF